MSKTRILNLYDNGEFIKSGTTDELHALIKCSKSVMHKAVISGRLIHGRYSVKFSGKYVDKTNIRKSKIYGDIKKQTDEEIYNIAKNLLDKYGNACVVKRAGYVIDRLRKEGYDFHATYKKDQFGQYWILEVKRWIITSKKLSQWSKRRDH